MPDQPTPQPATTNQATEATVVNSAAKPLGVLPKNVQLWLMSGIALVMVLVIALSGDPTPREKSAQPKRSQTVVDPNAQRINEYRQRIDEQAQRLAAEQARLNQAKQGFLNAQGEQAPPSSSATGTQANHPPTPPPNPEKTQKEQIEAEKIKREYLARFSSNVALTLREEKMTDPPKEAPQPAAEPVEKVQPELTKAESKGHRLFEGTILEAVLTNRLNGAFAGPVNAMLTTAVYSHDRQHLLIPQGSRILGEVKRVDSVGQQRLAVVFHRIVMPDGFSVNLDQFQGLNQIGETGLRDKVDRHYRQIFGVSIALGAIAGLSNYNTRLGFDSTGADAYRQGFSTSLSQSGVRILDRFLNILPTFLIREGHRLKIYLAGDLLVPDYASHRANHRLAPDL